MMTLYLGRDSRAGGPPRWTYRKAFFVIAISGLAIWTGVISAAHVLLT